MNKWLLLVGLLWGLSIQAQNAENGIIYDYQISKMTYSAPIELSHAEEGGRILLGMLAEMTAAGGSQFSFFAVSPTVSVLEEGKTEGIKTLLTVKLNLNLRIVNLITGESLDAFDIVLAASGNTRSESVRRAIQQLRNKKAVVLKNLKTADAKINRYYEDNCQQIVAQAKDKTERNEFAAAFTLLSGIPIQSSCYTEVSALRTEAFNKVQQIQCETLLTKADALTAANDFTSALRVLSQMDASAPCASTVKAKITAIEAKLDDDQKNRWEWLLKYWTVGAEVEKARWNAYAAICMDWLRSNIKVELIDKK